MGRGKSEVCFQSTSQPPIPPGNLLGWLGLLCPHDSSSLDVAAVSVAQNGATPWTLPPTPGHSLLPPPPPGVLHKGHRGHSHTYSAWSPVPPKLQPLILLLVFPRAPHILRTAFRFPLSPRPSLAGRPASHRPLGRTAVGHGEPEPAGTWLDRYGGSRPAPRAPGPPWQPPNSKHSHAPAAPLWIW